MAGLSKPPPGRSVNSAHPLRSILATLSAGICAFTIVIFQSWFMPYFLPFFTGRDEFARLVFHALYGGVLTVSIAVLSTRRDVRSAIIPLAIAAAMALAPVALHPVGIVAKCYLITLFLGGAAIVLMLASAPAIVLRLSASVTALTAIICFLDLFFANGFTNTPGRAAGLAINPNVAAAGLLLGAAASYGYVAKKWRASFFVLVGAALLVTLSRSTLLAAFVTVAVPVAVRVWQRYRLGRQFLIDPSGWARALAVAFVLLGAIGVALTTNAYFRVAIGGSLAGALSVGRAIDEAKEAVDTLADRPPSAADASPSASVVPPTTTPETRSANPPADAAPSAAPSDATASSDAKMQALGERLTDEGKRNSISARALFLERGLLAYREGGFFGRGLEEAQALAPHNTFVLFAIAFGHLGWLIPIGLVGFAFLFARDARDLPLGIAVVGVMLTSHDILLTPSLFLPVALGIGGMLAARKGTAQEKRATWSSAYGAVAGATLFATGCIAILSLAPSVVVERLQTDTMLTARGGYQILLSPPQYPGLFQFNDLSANPPLQAPWLREERTSLRRVDWSPHAWPAVRQGEYTFRQRDTVLFAATDSSDPRQNGRTYEVAVPLSVSTLCFILLGTIIAWSFATLVSFRQPQRWRG